MKMYVVALVVVVGVLGGFYGGYKVGQNNVSASASTTGNRGTGSAANGFTGGGRGLGGVCPSPGASPAAGTTSLARGTVADLTGKSMTVASTNCDVKITFGPTVTISKQVLGTTADLQDNQTVTVTGTRQADGSILASAIQIGPAGGARTGTGSGSTGGG
ncbi:MAG: hypothetical protein E6I73_08620 [Chloroflexi bacterium]|nr:MAG: hypothetical protein E6I73_08620 [Chloroflexota bacterium]